MLFLLNGLVMLATRSKDLERRVSPVRATSTGSTMLGIPSLTKRFVSVGSNCPAARFGLGQWSAPPTLAFDRSKKMKVKRVFRRLSTPLVR
jgi:hypothetical protein